MQLQMTLARLAAQARVGAPAEEQGHVAFIADNGDSDKEETVEKDVAEKDDCTVLKIEELTPIWVWTLELSWLFEEI